MSLPISMQTFKTFLDGSWINPVLKAVNIDYNNKGPDDQSNKDIRITRIAIKTLANVAATFAAFRPEIIFGGSVFSMMGAVAALIVGGVTYMRAKQEIIPEQSTSNPDSAASEPFDFLKNIFAQFMGQSPSAAK